ncbi:MAG: ComF family protein [Candidatus Planktophila sp.]
MSSLTALSELLFPTRCLGCRRLGIRICSQCRAFWHPHIYRSKLYLSEREVPVYSAVAYSLVAQKVLLGSKESALKDADQLIAQALLHSLSYMYSEIGIADLVPVPSRKSASRKRGRDFIFDQSKLLARDPRVEVRPILQHQRKVKDQSALNAHDREINLRGALSCANRADEENIPVIIVDDLLTSGATLREAARALFHAGYEVIGAVTACVAKPLRYTQ